MRPDATRLASTWLNGGSKPLYQEGCRPAVGMPSIGEFGAGFWFKPLASSSWISRQAHDSHVPMPACRLQPLPLTGEQFQKPS
eukprot:Skav232537  [mRNA]  locus=scaffold319:136136:136384:+ [translate_table: standard]